MKAKINGLGFGILLTLFCLSFSKVVVVNGGQVSVEGAITTTQIDIMVNYTANVKWLAIIFSPDQVNADVHLLQVDQNDAAFPVKVKDAYLDQLSSITIDDISNIQPSIRSFNGDISNGLKIAYSRNLATGDSHDLQFYPQEVIQICFMSSTQAFVGGGYETGHQKICSFFSLHSKLEYFEDRLLGNYATSMLIGGSNLTIYATQSTQGANLESWLFVSVVHKQQGLNPYIGQWIGITYEDSLMNTDLAVIEDSTKNFIKQVHINDMYITDINEVKQDSQYVLLQGGNDILKVAGGLYQTKYIMASYKRKFSTGDVHRDKVITSGNQTFCVILGNSLQYTTFSISQRKCMEVNIDTPYYANFRVVQDSQDGSGVITYTPGSSGQVKVIKATKFQKFAIIGSSLILALLAIIM